MAENFTITRTTLATLTPSSPRCRYDAISVSGAWHSARGTHVVLVGAALILCVLLVQDVNNTHERQDVVKGATLAVGPSSPQAKTK